MPAADAGPTTCVPSCRSGFFCSRGTCISACNPLCASNETCSATGQCVLTAGGGGGGATGGGGGGATGGGAAGGGAGATGGSTGTDGGTDAGPGCVPVPIADTFTANGLRNLTISRGGSVAYAMPLYPDAGRTIELLSIQSTSSQSDLTSEFSLSTCPGAFTNIPAECKTWGTVNQSGTQLMATTNATPVAGSCTLIIGTQYYVNVRNVAFDRVTPSCTPSVCYMILQLNSY